MLKGLTPNRPTINRLGVRPFNRSAGLPPLLLAKFLYLWTGEYDGDNLLSDLSSDVITVTGKDWVGSEIPPTTIATFSVPDNATYLAADGTDDFWFDAGNVLQSIDHGDLIASETLRSFVKYTDFEPYNVSAIGILKDGEVLTDSEKNAISKYFKLWIFYFGVFSDYGYLKDNRTID